MRKQWIMVFLVLALLFCLPALAGAASRVDVGGTQFNAVENQKSGTGWRWEAGAGELIGTLYLDSAYTGERVEFFFGDNGQRVELHYSGDVSIGAADGDMQAALACSGGLLLKGVNGTLTVTHPGGADTNLTNMAINARNMLTIEGGRVVARATANVAATGEAHVIWAYQGMTVKGGASLSVEPQGSAPCGGALLHQAYLSMENGGSVYIKGQGTGYAINGGLNLQSGNIQLDHDGGLFVSGRIESNGGRVNGEYPIRVDYAFDAGFESTYGTEIHYYVKGQAVRTNIALKAGYTFTGWTDEKGAKISDVLNYDYKAENTAFFRGTSQYTSGEYWTVTMQTRPESAAYTSGGGQVIKDNQAILGSKPYNDVNAYDFVGWEIDGSIMSRNPLLYYTPSKDVTVVAVYTIRSTPPANSPDPAPPAQDVVIAPSIDEGGDTTLTNNGGGSYTATADPAEDYAFSHWEDENGNIVSTEESYTFVATENQKLTAVFEENGRGVVNTFPEIVTATVQPNIQGSTAHVFLNEAAVLDMISKIPKAAAEGRIARLTLDTKKADSLRLRLSPAALRLLLGARVDALELRSNAGEIYMDAEALEAAYKASSAKNQTFQLLVQPKGENITVSANLYKGATLTSLGGLLAVRLPWEAYASVDGQPSYYDSRNGLLVVSPESFGTLATAPLVGNLSWAADYIYYAIENKLLSSGIVAGRPYVDAEGKTYTRTAFAAKLVEEARKGGIELRPLRARYPFVDNASKAAVALQQAGVISPLSDGTFSGNKAITNAEAAAWLARLHWLTIDPLSPYRWAITDDGKGRLFYSFTGAMVQGKHTIDGVAYDFGTNGIAQ